MTGVAAVTLLAAAGCAGNDTAEGPIEWSAQWFQCESSYECIAVLDAYCKYTAVNSGYSLVYQDWARQQVQSVGEMTPCMRDTSDVDMPQAAVCRSGTCEQPGRIH
ncbi:MAG: hypothetical protein KDI09_21275 [Halioglobus sp.]|nr:hypothetical protein [Halioglobus sp.]